MPAMSAVEPGALVIICERYWPRPSCVMPRWTGTPRWGTSANFTVLFGASQMASDRSRSTLRASMSKAAENSMSPTWYDASRGRMGPGLQPASDRSRHRLRVVHGGHRAVAGSRGDGVEPRVARRRRLIAGGPVHLVVEDAMDEVPRGQRSDVGEGPEAHQHVAVPVEDDRAPVGTAQRDAEADGTREAHRADHVEVLGPVGDGAGFARRVAVGAHE